MLIKWEVDDTTVVELKFGAFSKTVLRINNQEIGTDLSIRRKDSFSFDLSGGRHAEIAVTPRFATAAIIDLRVDGQLMVPTGKKAVVCLVCGTAVRPNDRFCGSCGHAMPPPENYLHQRQLKEATNAIWTLAVLFCVAGVIMFFLTQSQAGEVLAKLDGMNPDATLAQPINGVTYTVSELRAELAWEPWSVLIVNFILAAVMTGLALWGRRAPLAAILVAAATYAVVIVTNAIIDPTSIAQGIYIKIIVILFLFRGTQSALALRTANA